MRKYGKVTFCQTNDVYNLIWNDDGAGFERLDLIKNLEDYNFIDTSNCTAAYYKKSKEMFYGDERLIRLVLKARNLSAVFNAKKVDRIEIRDKKAYMIATKEDKNIGFKWEQVLENGVLFSEYFQTPEVIVEIDSISRTSDMNIEPVNKSDYIIYSIITDQVENRVAEADYYSEEYLRARYNISHIDDEDYVVVKSMIEADARLKQFREAPTKVKAIDLETTGTETGMYGNDVITGIVLSWSENDSTYYPFRQEKFKYNLPISFMRQILDAVNNQPEDVVIVAYNGKFEIQGIWKESKHYIGYSEYARAWDPDCVEHGLDDTYLRIDEDPFYASIICNPVFKRKGVHTLKTEAYKTDGKVYLELENVFKDKKNIKFNVLPENIVRLYACPDTPNTIKVRNRLVKEMPAKARGIYELESKMIYVTAENEFYGMRTEKELLLKLIENEEYKVKLLGDMFCRAHHTNKNINSPEVRRDIFYNKLRCPVEVRTNKGLPSTSDVALKRIIELGTLRDYDKSKEAPPILDLNGDVVVKGSALSSNRYPSLVMLGAYAKAMKQLGAYKRIQRTSLRDRVMFYVNQYGAATGRRTSDAHQYSDGMKKVIVADSKHHYLWSADFKQIELRLLAYLAGQQDLIELESNPNIDIHRAITSIITGQPIWAISAAERKRRKSTNFGVVYMMSAYGLAKTNAGPAYTHEDYVDALKSINDFYAGLPKINQYVKANEDFVRQHGFIENKFGRRRDFKEILDPAYPEKDKASMVRAANNMPVQGFGADLLKIVELNLLEYIREKGWDEKVDCDGVMLPKVRLMLSIHDEVLVSSHESIPIAEIITMFKICMELKVAGAPPFFAAPAKVGSWYDGKLDKYELDLNFRDEIVEAYAKDGTELIHADTYLEELTEYRSRRLRDYMDGLIRQYKTPEAVADHVRHEELTHTLISIYITKDDKLDHMESILEATKRYMESRDSGDEPIVEVESEKEAVDGLSSFEELEEFIRFDENGEAVIEDADGTEEEDDLRTVTEGSMFVPEVARTRAIYSSNQVFIDLNEFKHTDERVAEIYKRMIDLYVPGGAYKVHFMINDKVKAIDFYMNYEPTRVDAIVEEVLNAS